MIYYFFIEYLSDLKDFTCFSLVEFIVLYDVIPQIAAS